jgi:hypothetical protein
MENFIAASLKTSPSVVVPETLQRRSDGEPYTARSLGPPQASQAFAVRSLDFGAFVW